MAGNSGKGKQMTRIRKTVVFLSSIVIVMLASGCASQPVSQSADREGVFVHITSGSDKPHDALMGLRMAQVMAEDRDTLVYFDVGGIDLVVTDGPDLEMAPFGSSLAMIEDLQNRGVTLFACPGCLEALGYTADDLRPGVKVAEKDAFFGFTEGRILTLDY